jgi:hypothetical protein
MFGNAMSGFAMSLMVLDISESTLLYSVYIAMFTLPQLLLLGEKIIRKSSFSVDHGLRRHSGRGRVVVDGIVSGEIRGTVTGVMHATVEGDVNLTLLSGSVGEEGGGEK